jgi:haloalkane dehalogenase
MSPLDRIFKRSPTAAGLPPVSQLSVLGRSIAFRQVGTGAPIVFFSGGVASSYMWRGVFPHMEDLGRCIAVDRIGTGESARLSGDGPDPYRLDGQRLFMDSLMDGFGFSEPITLVVHGDVSMTVFDWARRHPQSVRALCHMESIVRPMIWPDLLDPARSFLKRARADDASEVFLESDFYLDHAFSEHVVHPLSSDAAKYVRRTFGKTPDARRAYLTGLTDIPIHSSPLKSATTVGAYSQWLQESSIPKLLIAGEPGYLLRDRTRVTAEKLPNQTVVSVIGTHLLPEDSPDGVGVFLSAWYRQQVASAM